MIAKSAKVCPNCGAKRRHPIKGLIKWLLLICIIAAVIGIVTNGNSSSDKTKNEKLKQVDAPKMTEKDALGMQYIEGSFKNVSGKQLSYVEVTFALFDKSGAQIGTAMDNLNNLAEGAVWKYKAMPLTTDEYVKFKITELTAW